jgi:hypothetical protein
MDANERGYGRDGRSAPSADESESVSIVVMNSKSAKRSTARIPQARDVLPQVPGNSR